MKKKRDINKSIEKERVEAQKSYLESTGREVHIIDGVACIGSKEDILKGDAYELLKDPDLFNKITVEELDKKIVGEVASRKIIFLCACGSFVMNHQTASFNLLVNDDAGVGKDYVCDATLELFPKEQYIHKTRISPTVFTYWHQEEDWTWDGKIFYPEDISELVLNSDVFKVMTSKGSSAVITDKGVAKEIDIKGKPVMITTTATATPNPELTRRFGILDLDSSQEQTKAIKKRHSQYAKEGIVPEYNVIYTKALEQLKRVKVKIPFADKIDEHFPDKNVIMRTNYPRFLDFIKASSSFHQFQRKKDNHNFVLAEGQDYDIARECFLKLCSNKYMIPLTINQKKILAVYEKEPILDGSLMQLYPKMNFLSERALMTNLRQLAKYGILEINQAPDSMNRAVDVYSLAKGYNPNDKIDIPTYEELCRITTTTTIDNPSTTSTTSTTTRDTVDTEDAEALKDPNYDSDLINRTPIKIGKKDG